jgi:hypothetical protein
MTKNPRFTRSCQAFLSLVGRTAAPASRVLARRRPSSLEGVWGSG